MCLFIYCFTNERVLGTSNIRPPTLLNTRQEFQYRSSVLQDTSMQRNLNHYIETQIHSEILLPEHVVAIVADPSFQNPI